MRRFPAHETEERMAARRASGLPVLPLAGTPSPRLPPHVRDAVAEAMAGEQSAAAPRGLASLRAAIARWLEATTGRAAVADRDVLVTAGAMHGLSVVLRALLRPGDEVVVPTPTFFFDTLVESAGGRCVHVRTLPDSGWAWDVDRIEAAVTPATRALLLCTPGNPTGRVHTSAEVAAALALAERHRLLVIADEAYEGAVFAGRRAPSPFADAERCVLIRSLGKSFSLPQLRVGAVAGPEDIVAEVATVLEWDVLRLSLVQQAAALAALDGPTAWIDEVRAGLEGDRDSALSLVKGAGLEVVEPGATPFVFVGEHPQLADALLGVGVPVVDGAHFHAPGWARLPVGGAGRCIAELREALTAATLLLADAADSSVP